MCEEQAVAHIEIGNRVGSTHIYLFQQQCVVIAPFGLGRAQQAVYEPIQGVGLPVGLHHITMVFVQDFAQLVTSVVYECSLFLLEACRQRGHKVLKVIITFGKLHHRGMAQ